MVRADKGIAPSVEICLQDLGYIIADWSPNRKNFIPELNTVLKTASKKQNGRYGLPDRIYIDTKKRLLILVEEKPLLKDHDNEDIEKGAVSGIKWYLSRFFNKNLKDNIKNFWDNWKILGIAVSGDLQQQYGHKFSCFCIEKQECKLLPQVTSFMTAEQFLALFNTLDEEKAIAKISSSSKKINNLLRSIDSQDRPVLLSALMICLHEANGNDFKYNYKTYNPETLADNVKLTAVKVLKSEGIPGEKLEILKSSLAFLDTDPLLRNEGVLKDILEELEKSVIPLFNEGFATKSNYDIIGKFYEEFLKYAGISNVKKGIVLTPRHITTLFTELVDIKDNDKIVDICCGTGAFLIAGMNKIIERINNSERTDKIEAIKKVKESQLLGFELNPTMYVCAISNMLFRGDGKSSIYNYDSIKNPKVQKILDNFEATIGFINPPYSGKENKENPTPKEITFLTKLLDNCSRYGIMIAPLSTYFKDDEIRNNILKKHTLKAVINMPSDLFQPNASTHTAIAVFETHRAFDYKNDEVLFYDLQEDGFVLAKNRGRTDVYNRWQGIKQKFLNEYKNPDKFINSTTILKTKIKKGDEWTIYAFAKPDYSKLNPECFLSSIKEYLVFKAKESLNILSEEINEIDLFKALYEYYGENIYTTITKAKGSTKNELDTSKWQMFELINYFDMFTGDYIPATHFFDGDTPYVSSSSKNNGTMCYNDLKPAFTKPCITIGKVDMAVFYQDKPFSMTCDATAIVPKENIKFNKYIAMFIKTVLNQDAYKWSYGRQIRWSDCKELKMKLPAIKNKDGEYEPDWQYMGNYIKTLPFGNLL